ncbi:MAG TPA: pyridoxamine 5'-phosphate oxidase family protein [Euzebyales bacterium]|nr:pyridoxamine 5'-phosphate oxidase family protein [Euzebyales bacterium]
MAASDTLLAQATRCLVAYRVSDGPSMTPMACWSDGGGLWMTTSRRAAKVAALRRDPRCALWIESGDPALPGVAVDGTGRIYDLSDPIGLALHAPTISAALAAMAVTHRAALVGYVSDVPQLPGRWMPQSRVLIRVRVDRARSRLAPQRRTGVGPLLPSELPAGVRRAVTGTRRVTLAMQRGDALTVQPAVWNAGFALDLGVGAVPDEQTPACIVVDAHHEPRPSAKVGVLLRGHVDGGLIFHPRRAVWWEGFESSAGPVQPPTSASGITLPD